MKICHLHVLVVGFLVNSPLLACLWDRDTLAMERARFPEVLELITGSFARHSREFHAWRIEQARKKIEADPQAKADYDDLAVSQHKLGDHQAAIETMMAKEKVLPGLYETCSNLGTFYIYTGDLQEALKWISKALEINADAHFGREKYQKLLVEWVLARRAGREEAEVVETEDQILRAGFLRAEGALFGFAKFVAYQEAGSGSESKGAVRPVLTPAQQAAALKGVKGMMLFADHDNPLLLEALGDLLMAGGLRQNAAQMACHCYLHAALKTADVAEKRRLSGLSLAAVASIEDFKVAKAEAVLKDALNKSAQFAEKVRQEEMKWIAEGKDAAAEFQKKYLKARK